MVVVKEKGRVVGEVKKEVVGRGKVKGWIEVVGLFEGKWKKRMEKRIRFVEKEMKEMEEEVG